MQIHWNWLFLDTPTVDVAAAWSFWAQVTGSGISARRGEREEFATLLPAGRAPWVKLQAVDDGPPCCHLDLNVDDPPAGADVAVGLGATRLPSVHDDVQVLRSPGGFVFCLTDAARPEEPTARTAPGQEQPDEVAVPDEIAVPDLLCLDIPADHWDVEVGFWRGLFGGQLSGFSRPEFLALNRPDLPLRLLLQRLDSGQGTVRAHPDLGAATITAAVASHRRLGAQLVAEHPWWTVMRAPGGQLYCLVDRAPEPA